MSRNTIDLLIELVKASFKMRYQNSFLGVLWVLIKPYSIFLVLYVIWSAARPAPESGGEIVEQYGLYLLLGILFHTFLQELLITGQMSLIDRAQIILKVNFKRQIAVLSAMFSSLINLLINMILVFFFVFLARIPLTLAGVINLVLVILIFFLFAWGVSLFLSIWTVRLRDLTNIVELGMFLLLWVTPIYYTFDQLGNFGAESGLLDLLKLNPLGIMINQARASLGIYDEINFKITVIALLISLVLVLLGWIYFQGKVKKIAEYF